MDQLKGSETHRVKDVVCIYSGGMDSFTLVAETHAGGRLHSCLSFNYGQRHKKELDYAANVCRDFSVPHTIIDLQCLKPVLLGSALTDAVAVPEGHYQEESMKLTVVPNRNMIMLSIAVAYAISHKLKVVRYGAHSGDHAIYPDCRPEFVRAIGAASFLADWHSITIEAPYLDMDKGDILERGYALGLDYADSWTCYSGGALACGRCGSCQERLEGFRKIGKRDPLLYEFDVPRSGT